MNKKVVILFLSSLLIISLICSVIGVIKYNKKDDTIINNRNEQVKNNEEEDKTSLEIKTFDTSNSNNIFYIDYSKDDDDPNVYNELWISDNGEKCDDCFKIKSDSEKIELLDKYSTDLCDGKYLRYLDNNKMKIYDIKNDKYYLVDTDISNYDYLRIAYDSNNIYGVIFKNKDGNKENKYIIYSLISEKKYEGNALISFRRFENESIGKTPIFPIYLELENNDVLELYNVFKNKIYTTNISEKDYEITRTFSYNNELIGVDVINKNKKKTNFNNTNFYSFKDNKILIDEYNSAALIDKNYIAFGKFTSTEKNKKNTYPYQVSVMNLESKEIKLLSNLTIIENEYYDFYNNDQLRNMFESNENNYISTTRLISCLEQKQKNVLYDINFNIIEDDFNHYIIYKDKVIVFKEKDGIIVYKSNNKILQNKDYILYFMDDLYDYSYLPNDNNSYLVRYTDNYLVLQKDKKIQLLSYEDFIKGNNNLIDTNIKVGKKDLSIHANEDEEEGIIYIEIEGDIEDLNTKKCQYGSKAKYYGYQYAYTFNLKDKTLEKKLECFPIED